MSFQPSINIMYDIGEGQLFEQYVPNIKQLDIMERMLNDLISAEQRHAHLLIGPYGAGKSLIGAMTTSLLTYIRQTKEIKSFLEDVRTVSPDIEQRIRKALSQRTFKWIPITITGKSGDFEHIILDSIQRQCQAKNISISLKHDATYILELLQIWNKDFPEVYSNLKEQLNNIELSVEELIKDLKESDLKAIEIFKAIYSKIAFGTVFHNPNNTSFIEQISFIFQQLAKKKISLFIVFDEFGRFLQTVSNVKIYDTMQQIQDLAELINRQHNAGLLMITHTGLQQYANANTNLTQKELERVEKRFTEHRLESDSSVFYRSAYKLLNKRATQVSNMDVPYDVEQLKYYITKYNLFADMSLEEIEGTIIKGCRPIHPLTIQLLPSISNLLGQNDRTLYMFLDQFEMNTNLNIWYYVDQLFDYFYPDESMLLTLDTMKYYRLAISYNVSVDSLRVVKFATLLNVINNRYPLTVDFIRFSLGIKEEKIQQLIEELITVKLLRFNPFSKSYELFEGALIVFEKLFKEVEEKTILSDEMRIEALEEVFDQRYFTPLEYNTAKSMTRYIETMFILGNQDIKILNHQDGALMYVIPTSKNERDLIDAKIRAYLQDDILFGIINIDFSNLSEQINQYLLFQKMLQMPEMLNEDYNLKKEIELRIETITYTLQQALKPIKTFEKGAVQYFLKGQEIEISGFYKFEECLDEWMYERFRDTPEIRNESFNKKNIMSIQRKAAISLLDQLLKPSFDRDFEISGYGPAYLIYATTFKNLDFNFKEIDEQPNRELLLLRRKLIEYIQTAGRSSIYQLFSIALEKPFGIRAPLVPLLVVALLKDKWHQMAFYANDFSLAEVNANLLYEILEQAVDFYEYEIYELSKEDAYALSLLNDVYLDGTSIMQPHVLFKEINKWLLSLPRFTQITNKQSEEYLEFKQIIRASETDPLLATKNIVKLNHSKEQYKSIKNELESFIHDFKQFLINETKAIFAVQSKEDVRFKFKETIQRSPKLLELMNLLEADQQVDAFIIKVVGVRIEDWSDITYDSYLATLNQLLTSIDQEETIRIIDGEQVVTTIKEVDLSVKGNTIYNQLSRIVTSGGRTMNPEEVKFILFKILQELK